MRAVPALFTALLVLSPSSAFAGSPAQPAGDLGTVSRIAAAGDLFGPEAASDAAYLIGATPDAPVWREASAAPGTFSTRASGRVTARLAPGSDGVEFAPGYESGLGERPPVVEVAGSSVKTMPGDQDTQPLTGGGTVLGSGSCPVRGRVSFTDTFGAPRSGGRTHEGTDMFAAVGTPVVAMGSGVLVRVDRQDVPGSLGGLAVSYVTAAGDRWYNAHFSAIPPGLALGQYVPAGTVIGFVGNSGDAAGTPSHLHIEYHPGGGAAAPSYAILARACR